MAEITTVKRIVRVPSDKSDNSGSLEKQKLVTKLIITKPEITLFFFAGGMMMAMNMAYRAIPIAPFAISGRIPEVQAPRKVPADQPRYGKVINPYI